MFHVVLRFSLTAVRLAAEITASDDGERDVRDRESEVTGTLQSASHPITVPAAARTHTHTHTQRNSDVDASRGTAKPITAFSSVFSHQLTNRQEDAEGRSQPKQTYNIRACKMKRDMTLDF